MKKIFVFLFLLVSSLRVLAGPIDHTVFFGDSLTDNGNLYRLLFNVLPKSPPYFEGRFSNGPTWAEHVGKYYYDKYYIDYKVYALGGATAMLHLPTSRFISPSNLELEVDRYLIDTTFQSKDKTLFAVWIGGNDYLFYNQQYRPEDLSNQVIERISNQIKRLASYGAKNFLILNLPDLSKTPFANKNGDIEMLKLLTLLNNQKLDVAIEKLRKQFPKARFTLFDMNALLNEVMSDPDKYNKKYNINITNTTSACWSGGYLFNFQLGNSFANQLQQAIIAKNGNLPKDADVGTMSSMIENSPFLLHAYQSGEAFNRGTVPCSNPEQYLFWDDMHPSEIVHTVLAKIVVQALTEQSLLA